MTRARDAVRGDEGSSPVEFVLVGGLLTLLTLAVVQFALAVYVRNIVHDAAVEGAFHAALADVGAEEGAAATREVIARAIGDAYAQDVSATTPNADTVRVTVRTVLPLIGMIGVAGALEVSADAPIESLD